jgi:hypothetical protein
MRRMRADLTKEKRMSSKVEALGKGLEERGQSEYVNSTVDGDDRTSFNSDGRVLRDGEEILTLLGVVDVLVAGGLDTADSIRDSVLKPSRRCSQGALFEPGQTIDDCSLQFAKGNLLAWRVD